MYLSAIFDNLVYGPFRQIYLNNEGFHTIEEKFRREMVVLTKKVLTELHAKLNLRSGQVTVRVMDGMRTYTLDTAYADSSPLPLPKYIDDSIRPFTGDVLRISRITHGECNSPLRLNVMNDKDSFQIVEFNKILIPDNYKLDSFNVEYFANYEDFSTQVGITNPETVWINMPIQLMDLVVLGIAAAKFGTVGIAGGEPSKGLNYSAMYRTALEQATYNGGIMPATTIQSDGYRSGGWV